MDPTPARRDLARSLGAAEAPALAGLWPGPSFSRLGEHVRALLDLDAWAQVFTVLCDANPFLCARWNNSVGPVITWAGANEAVLFWSALVVAFLAVKSAARYRRLADKVSRSINLGPVTISGTLGEKLGTEAANGLLHDKLVDAHSALTRDRSVRARLYLLDDAVVSLVRNTFAGRFFVREADFSISFEGQETLKIGPVEVPLATLVRFVSTFMQWYPPRKRYLASVIHVSVVAQDGETVVSVQKGRDPERGGDADVGSGSPPVLTTRAAAKSLEDLDDVFLDAAYMVIELWGHAFVSRNAHGTFKFVKGWRCLKAHALGGGKEQVEKALTSFREAVELNPYHLEAHYSYAALLYHRGRYDDAIHHFERAIQIVNRVPSDGAPAGAGSAVPDRLTANERRLRTLAHLGIAYCHCQRVHRLAAPERTALLAREKAAQARRDWDEIAAFEGWDEEGGASSKSARLDLAVHLGEAFAAHAYEGVPGDRKQARESCEDAVELYEKLLGEFGDSARARNNFGWVLLKLSEWEIEEAGADETWRPTELSEHASRAEEVLRSALDLDERNAYTHANLAELYGQRSFQAVDPRRYGYWARHHARRALELREDYTNGHRTMATTLIITGGDLGEAKRQYDRALNLAGNTRKVERLIREIRSAVQQAVRDKVLAPEELEKDRWSYPAFRLQPVSERVVSGEEETPPAVPVAGEAAGEQCAVPSAQRVDGDSGEDPELHEVDEGAAGAEAEPPPALPGRGRASPVATESRKGNEGGSGTETADSR